MFKLDVVSNVVQYGRHVYAFLSGLPCFVGNSILMMASSCLPKAEGLE